MSPLRNTLHVLRADARGGLEVSTLHVVRYLAAQRLGRHAALFLSPLADGISVRLRELGVDVAALPYDRTRRLAFVRALARRMREMAPDLVLVHGAFGLHALVAAAARSAGVERVWTFVVNRPPPGGLPRVAQQAMAHAARPFATGEIAVSDFVRRVLIDEYRLPAHRVHTAYRWRELDRIERTALAGRRTAGTGPVLGTIGRLRLDEGSRQRDPRTRRILRRSLPGARLVIVGEGADREALAALARELGVADHVALVGHQADVAQALGGMDLFVFATTQFEGLPNVLVEAMAARVPIVCTDVGPCREVLAGGTAGLLVPPRAPEALAAAGRRAVAQPRAAPRAGRDGAALGACPFHRRGQRAGAGAPALPGRDTRGRARRAAGVMRILLVTPASPFAPDSGAAQRTALLHDALVRLGSVDVLLLAPGADTRALPVPDERIALRAAWKSLPLGAEGYARHEALTRLVAGALDLLAYDLVVGRYLGARLQARAAARHSGAGRSRRRLHALRRVCRLGRTCARRAYPRMAEAVRGRARCCRASADASSSRRSIASTSRA